MAPILGRRAPRASYMTVRSPYIKLVECVTNSSVYVVITLEIVKDCEYCENVLKVVLCLLTFVS